MLLNVSNIHTQYSNPWNRVSPSDIMMQHFILKEWEDGWFTVACLYIMLNMAYSKQQTKGKKSTCQSDRFLNE